MTKLKPCPFCGRKGEYESKIIALPILDDGGAYIGADEYCYERCGCQRCDIWFESYDDNEPVEITIKRWNKRAGDSDDNTRSDSYAV